MNLNRVELIGFLGSEPETTYTPNGKAVATLSVATKTSWMKGDQRQERTGFVNLIWPTFATLIWPTPGRLCF